MQAQSLYAAGIQQPPYITPEFPPYQLPPQIPTLPLNADFIKATGFLESLAAVDFSLPTRSTQSPRNGNNTINLGNLNGETPSPSLPVSPSLSVRDVKQINSLAERRQVFTDIKRPKRFETILERLNANSSSTTSVIVSATHSSQDDSNSGNSAVTVTSPPEDEQLSNASNEDSVDGVKSRRKRKPIKTVRLSREDNKPSDDEQPLPIVKEDMLLNLSKQVEPVKTVEEKIEPEKPVELVKVEEPVKLSTFTPKVPTPPLIEPVIAQSVIQEVNSEIPPVEDDPLVNRTRRRTLSETETIENIAAMIASTENDDKMEIEKISSPIGSPNDSNCKLNLENVLSSPTHPPQPQTVEEKLEETSVLNPEPGKSFVEVENQLEKMFAGLEDMDGVENGDEQPPTERVTSTSSDLIENLKPRKKGTKPKKFSIKGRSQSNESTPTKAGRIDAKAKFKTQKIKINKIVKTKINEVKDVLSYDSGSNNSSIRSRGPFIQIRGPRDSPHSVNIVNAPSTDQDELEKSRSKLTKKSFHDDSEYRGKVRSKGLHSSTLSIKYDAHTTDTSWICVFCKRGPHTSGNDLATSSTSNLNMISYSSGDLFGPYTISSECQEYQESIEDLNEVEPEDPLALSPPTHGKFSNKKAKKKHLLQQNHWSLETDPLSGNSPFREHSAAALEGMIESDSKYEIWAHEDCIVWCPGVYLAGPRIVGLEGAVWSCCSVKCEHCSKRGAAVSCLMRNCKRTAHVGCAKLSGWFLDEDTYKAYCQRHKKVS